MPETMRLNQDTLDDLRKRPPASGRRTVYDQDTPRLAVTITPTGSASWYLIRRSAGASARLRLGSVDELKPRDARKEAARLNGEAARGVDVAAERRQTRAEMTMSELFTAYIEHHAKPRKRTWQADQRTYDLHLKRWGSRRLSRIKRADVAQLHTEIGTKAGPYAANRTLALLSCLFNVAADLGAAVENPCKGIRKYPEAKRERFLEVDELPPFIKAVKAYPDQRLSDFILLAMWTAARRGNLAAMEWAEVDMKRHVWHIPATKNGDALTVPLVPEAMEILRRRQAEAGEHRYVFPNRTKGSAGHIREPKTAFSKICETAGVRDLRFHDLRRTCATYATYAGVPYPVVAKMLGHRTAPSVTAVYARATPEAVRQGFEKAVRAMMATTKIGVKLANVRVQSG